MKTEPELLPLDINPNEYDVLFIGTPVWAWTYAPALNTFFSTCLLSNRRIALFCCHGGGKGGIFDKMKAALRGNQILGQIDFREPSTMNTEANIQRAKKWAEEITKVL